MGLLGKQRRRDTRRHIRKIPLTEAERRLLEAAVYEGNPQHKRNPGDFGLTPPAAPRPDKTLCDEANLFRAAEAHRLFRRGVEHGLVSEATTQAGYPKGFWVVDDKGQVFEAANSGGPGNVYHGYPVRRSDPFFDEVRRAWDRDR